MSWKFGLIAAMKDPNLVLYSDELICVINDAYPKAEVHMLVLPHENIPDLKTLGKEHLGLLRRMERKGREMAQKCGEGRTFKVIADVESLGRVKLPSEKECALLLKTQMKCNRCSYTPKHMPDLKRHILTHLQD